jgi:hypothetical protein
MAAGRPRSLLAVAGCAVSALVIAAYASLAVSPDDGVAHVFASAATVVPSTAKPSGAAHFSSARSVAAPDQLLASSAFVKSAIPAATNTISQAMSVVSNDGGSGQPCAVGPTPPDVHFEQVKTYVGAVPAEDLRVAMADLAACFTGSPIGHVRSRAPPVVVDAFAIDGTLLNLLRWGRIVNDNDVDVGVVARGVPHANVSEHYFATMRRLVGCGFIDEPSPKQARKLHNQHKVVKPRRCLLRPQMMQCRHANGVIVDVFGPETVFSALTRLDAAADVLPTVPCRAFDATFPCPRNSIASLKQFTMQFPSPSTAADAASKTKGHKAAWYEFAGCALLPLRASERDAAHVKSILADVTGLRKCGYPSLLADAADPACVDLITKAGVALTNTAP